MGAKGFKDQVAKGYEDERNDPKLKRLFGNYRDEPVTAETIKDEAEKPFKNLAQLGLFVTKTGAAYNTLKIGNNIRQRYQQFPFRGGDAPLIDVKSISTKPTSSAIVNQNQGVSTSTSLTNEFGNFATVNFEDKGGFANVENWTLIPGGIPPRQSTINKLVNGKIYKTLNHGQLQHLSGIISGLENYQQKGSSGNPKFNPLQPTRGFSKTLNDRLITLDDGRQIGIGWNRTDQGYYLFDYQKAQASSIGRYKADRSAPDPFSQMKTKARKGAIKVNNAQALEALERIKETNPDLYFDIIGGDPDSNNVPRAVWTVEHINSRTSGVWRPEEDGRLVHKFRKKENGEDLYFGDVENLMPATGTNYGDLKTSMEAHLASLKSTDINYGLYIDIDPVTRNFVIRKSKNGELWEHPNRSGQGVQINGMTPANKWKSALYHVLDGGEEIDIASAMLENPGDPAILLETNKFGANDPNTRLEPPSGNIGLSEAEIKENEIRNLIRNRPIEQQARIMDLYERIQDAKDPNNDYKPLSWRLIKYEKELNELLYPNKQGKQLNFFQQAIEKVFPDTASDD